MAVGVAVGNCTVADDRLGPTQFQPVVAAFVCGFRLTVPPTHIGPLLVTPVDDGIGLTDTVVV